MSLRLVQYHLDKVFTKLDIASRTQLSAPCPATTIGQFRVDAGEQAGAQQQILDLVWLALSISSIRHSATVRLLPENSATNRSGSGGQPAEVSLDGGIHIHAALPTERLRRTQVVEIADDQNEA